MLETIYALGASSYGVTAISALLLLLPLAAVFILGVCLFISPIMIWVNVRKHTELLIETAEILEGIECLLLNIEKPIEGEKNV